MQTTPSINPPRADAIAEKVAGVSVAAALLASTAMSGFGIGSAFWDGLVSGNPAAWTGLAIIGGALAASEFGAVAVAMSITRDGVTVARAALFGFCTLANVLAGHFGAEAINTRLVAPQRAPYEQAAASAAAEVDAARNSLSAWIASAATERADLERQIEAERVASPGAVTARGRDARLARESMANRQRAERAPLDRDVSEATRAKARADSALATEAPKGMGLLQQWALSALLECLKGVLVWVAAPRRRKLEAGTLLTIQPAEVRNLTTADAQAAWDSLAPARTLSTTLWHELRRRAKTEAA